MYSSRSVTRLGDFWKMFAYKIYPKDILLLGYFEKHQAKTAVDII